MTIKDRNSQEDRSRTRWIERNYDTASGLTRPDYMELTPTTEEEEIFRHSGWAHRRKQVRAAMASAGIGTTQTRRFDTCGSAAYVYWSKSEDRHYVRAHYCKCRYCQPCAQAKANRIAKNIHKRLSQKPAGRYYFMTLPLKHSTAPLTDQVKRLLKCWNKLKRSKLLKTINGGCWTMEIKTGRDGLWHPHLHFVFEGRYIAQRELSDHWHKITGDSPIVDIRQVRNCKDVGHELSKYIAKGTSQDVFNDHERLVEYIIAIKGTRTCGTFGNWRDIPLTEKAEMPTDLEFVGRLTDIVRKARAGERWAQHLIDYLMPADLFFNTS